MLNDKIKKFYFELFTYTHVGDVSTVVICNFVVHVRIGQFHYFSFTKKER